MPNARRVIEYKIRLFKINNDKAIGISKYF